MPLMLHMTDLHLSAKAVNDVYDDYKIEILPPAERVTKRGLLRNTLVEMRKWLNKNKKSLSAIVITGDITVGNEEDGFKYLDTLLNALGEKLPKPDRIVVVPGNHDVTWTTTPSSTDRYKYFREYVRKRGYVTPFLDGIDIDADGAPLPDAEDVPHCVIDDEAGWMILPINSANYSGSVARFEGMDDLWDVLPGAVAADKKELVKSNLLKARLHDVARISKGQLIAIRDMIDTLDPQPSSKVRIAALHHQLLAVSDREEFKSFESIVNLGRLRNFLARAGVQVVLHGHKHYANVYRDEVQIAPEQTRRIHVVSGSTLGGDQGTGEVYRLIDVNTAPAAPGMHVTRIPAVESGDQFSLGATQHASLWEPPADSAFTVIEAANVDEAYAKLMARLDADGAAEKLSRNVIVHVRTVDEEPTLPANYPADYLGATRELQQAEFNAVVKWWQRESSDLKSGLTFTHGARLHEDGQVEGVVKLLRKNSDDRGRAVVTLLRPNIDKIDEDNAKFPSFVLVQFTIDAQSRLCCLGYFRKQELRYWWPVNIAELADLQRVVFNQVAHQDAKLKLGPITTIAAVAVRDDAPSRVAIPLIDRYLDMEKAELWRMIYALVLREPAEREQVSRFWKRIIDDLRPPPAPARDGTSVAIDGLAYVQEHLSRFASHHGQPFARLAAEFGKLALTNKTYLPDVAMADPKQYKEWLKAANGHVDEIQEQLGAMLDPPAS